MSNISANWLYKATYQCKTPILVHSGGSSSSKTYSILQALFTIACTNPNRVITVVGQDLPNLKKGAIRDSKNIIESTPIFQNFINTYNKSDYIYTFKNNSIIEFTSYDDELDARSGKRTHCFINEANGVAYGIFEQLRIRTTDLMVIDFNPSAQFWAHEKLQGRDDVTWINSTFRDNAFINATTRDAILSYEPTPENIARGTANEYRWKVYGLGEVGRLEGLVFPEFKVDATFPAEYKWRVFGMDFGYTNDPTTLIEIRYAEGKLYWRQHIYETGLTNPDIAERLKDIEHPPGEVIIADSAEPKSIAELKRMGWHIKPAIKGTDSVMNGIDAIKRYPNVIHAGSRDLITEFNSYTWKKDRNGNAMNVPIDQYNHAIDAGRYALSHHLLKPKKDIEFYFA
jgi:phage terminase large subunit